MDTIGGYRLVRKLGAGERADVFLGHAGSSVAGLEPRTAAVKVYRASTTPASVDAEIESLARASSAHLARLDDLATAPDGHPVLILGRLSSLSLAQLLAGRGGLAAGEAVTIVAPLALAVAELHRVGVAHGRLRLGSVLFDRAGAPVIARFGGASIVGPMPDLQHSPSLTPAALADSPEVLRDLADLVSLARGVIELTPETPSRSRLLEWLANSDSGEFPDRYPQELCERVFDLAPATRIRLDSARSDVAAHAPTRAPTRALTRAPSQSVRRGRPGRLSAAAIAEKPGEHKHELPERRRPAWLASLHLPEWLDELWRSRDLAALRTVGAAVRRLLAPVRKPVWFAAGTIAVLLVAALALIPADDDSGTRATSPSPTPESHDGGGVSHRNEAVLVGDDPVAAVAELLELRAECLRTLSVLCLDDVDQSGSAAWEADGYLVRELQSGASNDRVVGFDGASATLVERMGNSAIIAVTLAQSPPAESPLSESPSAGSAPVETAPTETAPGGAQASILVVKGEAGWRIRDLIIG